MSDGAAFLLPWNHPDRLAAEEPAHLRRWLLRLCRIDRIALRRLPAGLDREIVALQLRSRQRSLARSRISRAMLTYGAEKTPEQWQALLDELCRQGALRAADDAAWRGLQASRPDPIEVFRQNARAAALRPALPPVRGITRGRRR